MAALVYYNDRVVEVPDASFTLGDLCDAFEVDVATVIVRRRRDKSVVATLPFDVLPQFDGEVYDLVDESQAAAVALASAVANAATSVRWLKALQRLERDSEETRDGALSEYHCASLQHAAVTVSGRSTYDPFRTATETMTKRWGTATGDASYRPYTAVFEHYSEFAGVPG